MKSKPGFAADALASLLLAAQPKRHARKASGRVPAAVGRSFELAKRPRNLPKRTALLALIDDTTLSVRALSEEERATLKPQFQRSGLTEAEEAALGKGGVTPEELALGPTLWTLARKASDDRYQSLLEGGLTVDKAAERLEVSTSRIRQLLGERRLYGIKVGGDWRLPAFQFLPHRRGLVPGMGTVLPVLPPDAPPLTVHGWFTTPNPDLPADQEEKPQTPLQWLRQGRDPEAVVALAAAL